MKSIGSLAFLALIAFYVAWPAYSGYEIKSALDAGDVPRLSAKIDFPSLRASLRPAVAVSVEKAITQALKKAGPASGPLTDGLRAQLMPRIIDAVLAALVTPETLIRVHAEGKSLKDVMDGIVAERSGQSGGLGELIVGSPKASGPEGALGDLGKAAEKLGLDAGKALEGVAGNAGKQESEIPKTTPAPIATQSVRPGLSFENIKHFSLNGPLGVAVGIARDPKAKDADLTAEMSFIDSDWKLTGLVPRI